MLKRLAIIWSNLFSVSWQTLFLYRIIHYLQQYQRFNFLIIVLTYIQQVISGCHIHYTAIIGNDCHFPHPIGIVIGQNVKIGERVTIFQHVTLGSHGKRNVEVGYPVIEDDVTFFANSTIIGEIHIGKGAVIGAHSLVLNDVPSYGLVYGSPACLKGFICSCGQKLIKNEEYINEMGAEIKMNCQNCGLEYSISIQDFIDISE